jgi:hypothetical protein
MSEPTNYLVSVGLPKHGLNAIVCETAHAKIVESGAKLETAATKRTAYIRARFLNEGGNVERVELGKWLLSSSLPVLHLNGEFLDFRIANLEARETDKQRKRRERAAVRRVEHEARKAKAAAKRAKKKPVVPDGLTPEEQMAIAFDEQFQKQMVHVARAICRDAFHRGSAQRPTDELRGDEVVAQVVSDSIGAIMAGNVLNVRAYLWVAMLTQARKELKIKLAGLGHVRRPRQECQTLSDAFPEEIPDAA